MIGAVVVVVGAVVVVVGAVVVVVGAVVVVVGAGVQFTIASLDCCVALPSSTNEARTVSVPALALVYVKEAWPFASVTALPVVPAFGPLATVKVTVSPATGVPPMRMVAVSVWFVPAWSVAFAGFRLMLLVDSPLPRARMYGNPTVPSGAVYVPSGVTAMARASKSDGNAVNDSWVEQLQFDNASSVSPARAGCVAVMWTSLLQPELWTLKPSAVDVKPASTGTGVSRAPS